MDLLFTTIEEVYFGRNLLVAKGHELDVIGRILGQSRNIELDAVWFTLDAAIPKTDGFSDEATPREGGLFFSETGEGFEITPLPDDFYRRLLIARARLATSDVVSIDGLYDFITLLLNRVPSVFSITEPAPQQAMLTLSRTDTTELEEALIMYVKHLVTPSGTTLNINLI